MDEGFIVDLSPEANNNDDTRFNVYAPPGGLLQPLSELLAKRTAYIDLDIRHGFSYALFRIYPGDNITRHQRIPTRYDVSDGYGVFLDEYGEECSSMISFGGYLETEATHEGSLTGELRLWKRELPDILSAS